MAQLLHNSIQCPDGTVLVSRHQHKFVEHVQDDGRSYFVDGGLAYQRIGRSDHEYIDLSVTTDDEHSLVRERFEWTRIYDADMVLLPKPEVVKLKNITDDHLDTLCLFTKDGYPSYINKVFLDEKEYRNSLI